MKPQDFSARTAYRPPAAWYRRLSWLGVLLTSLGEDYLVAPAGESQWVRNLRAAGGSAVIADGYPVSLIQYVDRKDPSRQTRTPRQDTRSEGADP